MPEKKIKRNRGFSIALVLMIMTIIMILGMAVATVGTTNLRFVSKDNYNTTAFYTAEAGLARGIAKLRSDPEWTGTTQIQGEQSVPTYENVKMPTSGATYSVLVYNNFAGTNNMPGFRNIQVPPGTCFIVGVGKVGPVGSEKAIKYVTASLKIRGPFEQFGLFGDDKVRVNGNMSVSAYDSENGQNQPGKADVGTNGNQEGAITSNGSAVYVDGSLWAGPGSILGSGGAITITGNPTITGEQKVLPQENPMPEVVIPTGIPTRTLPSDLSFIDTRLALNYEKRRKSTSNNPRYKFIHLASRGKPDSPPGGGGGGGGGSTITLQPGDYNSSMNISSQDTVVLTGPGTYVFKDINISGQGKIEVDTTNGPIKIYLDGNLNMTGGSTTGGIFNKNDGGSPKPTDLLIYGTDNCTNVDLRGNSQAYLAVYAPNAEINMRGNADLWGALVGKEIWVHGHPGFTYDIALGRLADDIKAIKVQSWQRL